MEESWPIWLEQKITVFVHYAYHLIVALQNLPKGWDVAPSRIHANRVENCGLTYAVPTHD